MDEEVKKEIVAKEKPLWFKALAELFGTALLVFFGCISALQVADGDGWAKLIAVSLAFAIIVMVLVYTIGGVSGAHLNPAASLAMAIDKRLKWKDFGVYCAAQVVGAFLGAVLIWAFLGEGAGTIVSTQYWNVATETANFRGMTSWAGAGFVAIILEAIGTCVFLYLVLAITADPKNGAIAGIGIALALWLSIAILFGLTGGSLNPARSLGTALVSLFNGTDATQVEPLKEIWVYIIGPMAGGAAAAGLFRFFNKSKYATADAAAE